MVRTIVNFVFFQACWFAAILGASKGEIWWGPIAVGISLVVQWPGRGAKLAEVSLYGAAILCGVAFDGALEHFGVLGFTDAADAGPRLVVPLWMLGLWVNFATTLPGCMAWLRRKIGLSAVLGAVGGPLAYWGGESFGAVELGNESVSSTVALGLVALEYAIATPLLVFLSNRVLPKPGSQES